MPNPYFSFKQFTIYHDRCAMKVGTDGVLLGAWASLPSEPRRLLDIGTGTGLIALMLAQRCNARITAIDIDDEAVSQAICNVTSSPWSDRIQVEKHDICLYQPHKHFDVIVTNPPYFVNSLKCPDIQRNTARHSDTLDVGSLIRKVAELLEPDGRFSIIIPAGQANELIQIADRNGLFPSRYTSVVTRPGLPPKRALMEFRPIQNAIQTDELVIELDRHVYSEDYITLTKDFYLKM